MLASVFGDSWLGLHGMWGYLPPTMVPLAAVAVYSALVNHFEQRSPWEVPLNRTLFIEGSAGFVFGVAFIAVMWLLLLALKLYSVHLGIWTHRLADFISDSYISALIEELAFRAVLLRLFVRLWGMPFAVLLSSFIFGLAHITHGSWLAVLGISINGGITMGLIYVITGRLWMSIGMHLGYDFMETSILGVASKHGFLVSVPTPGKAAWLTGGTFGPDAAIPAILLGVLLNVALWRYTFGVRRSASFEVSALSTTE